MDDVKPTNQHSGLVEDWTDWHMLDEDTAVVVVTDIVITESVVAAAGLEVIKLEFIFRLK